MEALKGKRGSGTVAQEALDAGTVVARDADGGIDAEPAGALPGEHALGVGFVEKGVPTEVPEHAALNNALEVEPVACVEQCRLVEAGGPVRDLGEDAVEDHEVEVEVWVEGRSEAVQEGHGAELSVEPRRVCRRPQTLRGWGHEYDEEPSPETRQRPPGSGRPSTARMVYPFGVPRELRRIEVHGAQIARGVPLGLVIEVWRAHVAALAPRRHRSGAHAVAELHHRHETVTAGAIPFLGVGIGLSTEAGQ